MKRKFTICCIITAAIILACLTVTGCSSSSSKKSRSTSSSNTKEYQYEFNNDKYSAEYLKLIHIFAQYCGVEDYEVDFDTRSVATVTNITDTEVTCEGRTKLYSFTAGTNRGDIYCDTTFIMDSISETPPHITDGVYYLSGNKIQLNGVELDIHNPISFDAATEDHLGYSSQEIANIIDNRFVEPLFGYQS